MVMVQNFGVISNKCYVDKMFQFFMEIKYNNNTSNNRSEILEIYAIGYRLYEFSSELVTNSEIHYQAALYLPC
jgi:hypothetical protein